MDVTFKSRPQLPTSSRAQRGISCMWLSFNTKSCHTRDDVVGNYSRPSMSVGFTLIELLIVLLILSISFGFALFSFGDFGKSREAKISAEQLQSLIRRVREQAILEVHDYTIQITKEGFKTLKQNSAGGFELHEHPQTTSGTFPNSTKVSPNLTIHIHASGEMTPFTLSFGTSSNPKTVILIGKTNGRLTLTQAP